jgi:DNA-binding NarL/FixJ family response regulator
MSIRVLLADDQELIRAGFRVLINSADDLTVVGEARTGEEAISLTRETKPDVVLMDIRMPGMDGIAATRIIRSDHDLSEVKILVLTTFEVDEYVVEAIEAGASGFLSKSVNPDDLNEAIRIISRGEALLSPKATSAVISRFARRQPRRNGTGSPSPLLSTLTDREREVLGYVALGLSNDEIAEHLHISVLTAKTHVNRAMTKLNADNRAQLVVIAYQSNLPLPGDG